MGARFCSSGAGGLWSRGKEGSDDPPAAGPPTPGGSAYTPLRRRWYGRSLRKLPFWKDVGTARPAAPPWHSPASDRCQRLYSIEPDPAPGTAESAFLDLRYRPGLGPLGAGRACADP